MEKRGDYGEFTETLRETFKSLLPDYIGGAHEWLGDKIKGDGTPVGSLDHRADTKLLNLVRIFFPDDNTVGEEDETKTEARPGQAEWSRDGLDGTGNRRMGLNSYGGALSRRQGDSILYAAVFKPYDQMTRGNGFYYAERGKGAWQACAEHTCYHQLLTARDGELERITVMLEGSSKKIFKSPEISALGKILTTRTGFSSCVAAIAVASGHASALVTVDNAPWDNLSSALFIQEAGGIVTDWSGNSLTFANSRNMIAAGNAADHAAIMQAMRS